MTGKAFALSILVRVLATSLKKFVIVDVNKVELIKDIKGKFVFQVFIELPSRQAFM